MNITDFIQPDWPAPGNVSALCTTRLPKEGTVPYLGFNLALHVGDDRQEVEARRVRLQQMMHWQQAPAWLVQAHTADVIRADSVIRDTSIADASFTRSKGLPCIVQTADCLPLLMCNASGTQVAAVHAGWRGVLNGIIFEQMRHFEPAETMVWLGPAISQQAFEVGAEVRAQFVEKNAAYAEAFTPKGDKFLADLYRLACMQLAEAGVGQIYGGVDCTFSDSEKYYSYRRDGETGRLASFIWINS